MHNRNEISATCIILASGKENATSFRQYEDDVREIMGNGLFMGVSVTNRIQGSYKLEGRTTCVLH